MRRLEDAEVQNRIILLIKCTSIFQLEYSLLRFLPLL